MLTKYLTFILYDSISNSIFISQVLKPILNLLQEDVNLEVYLISFEKTRPSNKTLQELIPAHNRLHFILCRRLPFISKFTLNFAVFQLNELFRFIDYQNIIARGPLAGWIAQKTLNNISRYKDTSNINLKIQARGLNAEEYRFSYQNITENFFIKRFRKNIYRQLHKIELEAYRKNTGLNFLKTIEAVSPALKEYLITNFNASRSKLYLAKNDIPQSINEKQILLWRQEVRNNLNIKLDQPVYCYSGSYKPWQCIPEIIEYFFEQYNKNKKCFLLILSHDKKDLENLLILQKIPTHSYVIIDANYNDLYKYMAASDVGLLFRDKDIINWVSRPTKMLEYEAVGLKIIHNQTINWLENQS
ncbi:MAG: Glycosyltransferase-like protein [candidate division TM6 bacterium GW2011_GWF2_28_16]|nr:MAG: Glycosyltransferase-like protein [candidate division TM6 bacterium GW2011_GWF2_28_16]